MAERVFVPSRGLSYLNKAMFEGCEEKNEVFVPSRGLSYLNTENKYRGIYATVFVPSRGLSYLNNIN